MDELYILRVKTEILHSNVSPQLGGYYCFYFLLYIMEQLHSFCFLYVSFWLLFERTAKNENDFLEFSLTCHLFILQIESLLQKPRTMSFYFYSLQEACDELKTLTNFPSFRFCMWSRFYCNLPSDSLMETGKTKWSSMTVVETTLNMIMNHVYMNIRVYDNVYLHCSKLQRRKYCLDLEVRNMKAF